MTKHVIVDSYVKIENFKNISMHVYIQNLHLGKVGVFLQDRKYIEDNLLCNILVKYFLQIVNKEERG